MSTKARVPSAVPGEPPSLRTALRHQPLLAERFGALYARFWEAGAVPARTKEITRMRNARVTDCGFCRNVRFDAGVRDGLDEEAVDDITDTYESSTRLSDAEKAALRLTDAIIFDPGVLDAEAIAELRRHYTPKQIAELGLGVALFLSMAKVLITLGMEPEKMERTLLATPTQARYAGDKAA